MTKIHGKGTSVTLDGNDLSTHATNVEWNPIVDSHDTTTFGRDAHRKQGGLTDGSATISGIYDDTVSTGPSAVIEPLIAPGVPVPLVYRPEGTGSGLPEKTVNVLVQSYTESAPVADMITWECSLEFSDSVIITTQA